MATLLPFDTAAVLGPNAEKCDSRSLLLDRFCNPTAKEKDRHQVFTRSFSKSAIKTKSTQWSRWLAALKTGIVIFYAQLQSRLILNMAGGVMENAGLCLDRFGLPYIPGSAVKGCARRAALAALREWCGAGGQPEQKPAGPENPLAECCASFTRPSEMLGAIARVFGWTEIEWGIAKKDGRLVSDFAWACDGASLQPTWKAAAENLARDFRWRVEEKHRNTPWQSLANVAGAVSFLSAYPVEVTGAMDLPVEPPKELGKLELDVVTCHHREYYEGGVQTATDTEEPVPVVFPAVAPGQVFVFGIIPLRAADTTLVQLARSWLKIGLQTFGLGAKTNAGYGFFNSSDAVEDVVRKDLGEQARRQQEEQRRELEEQRRKAEEQERRLRAEAAKAATKDMTTEQKADYEVAQLTPDQFRGRLDQFAKRERFEQEAMVRAMRLSPDSPSSRRKFWDDLKEKAKKGGKSAQIEQAIRQLSKQLFPGKEGKMP